MRFTHWKSRRTQSVCIPFPIRNLILWKLKLHYIISSITCHDTLLYTTADYNITSSCKILCFLYLGLRDEIPYRYTFQHEYFLHVYHQLVWNIFSVKNHSDWVVCEFNFIAKLVSPICSKFISISIIIRQHIFGFQLLILEIRLFNIRTVQCTEWRKWTHS